MCKDDRRFGNKEISGSPVIVCGIMIARCAIQADCPPQKVADYTGDPLLGKEMNERKFPTAFYKKNLRITSSFF